MASTRGVYLFDEFDAIGADRSRPNEVGEMRRALNSLLQLLESDDSDSLILAATNHANILNVALFRQFDDVVRYDLPNPDQVEQLARNRLNTFQTNRVEWSSVREAATGLSYVEVARACTEAAKAAVLTDRRVIETWDVTAAMEERRRLRDGS